MKKLIIIFLLSFIASYSFAQLDTLYPSPPQNLGAKNVLVRDTGGLVVRQMFLAPIYPDTTTANTANPYTRSYVGSVIYTQDIQAYWFRQDIPRKWVLMGSSGGNNNTDTIYTEIPIAVKIDSLGRHIIYLLHPNEVVQPGYVVWTGVGLVFNITPALYYMNYLQYTSPAATVTLAAAGISTRSDLFIVDTLPEATVITGQVGGTVPQTNPSSQLSLTSIDINPGDVVPANIQLETIYNDHIAPPTEWTPTSNGTIAVDYDNTANVYIGTKAAFVSVYGDSSNMTFTKGSGTDTVQTGEILRGFIYFNVPFVNQLQFQWFNGSTAVSNSIAINAGYGINPNNTTAYQIFAIPLNAWNFTPAGNGIFNRLVIRMAGADSSGAGGFYLDYLQLQTGLLNIDQTPPPAWLLNGNSGTNPTINFIGTTDANSIRFKTNNFPSGWISTSNALSVGYGYGSLPLSSIPFWDNSAFGALALQHTSTGTGNVGVGTYAATANTTGIANVAVGVASLFTSQTGYSNTAIGTNTLYNTTTGHGNSALGDSAGRGNTTGNYNIFFGYKSGITSTTASNTLFISDSTYHGYWKNLDSAVGSAPNVIAIDDLGFIHRYANSGGGGGNQNLQQTTDNGNVTTRAIKANQFDVTGTLITYNIDSAGKFMAAGHGATFLFDKTTGDISFQPSVNSGSPGGTPSFGTVNLLLKADGSVNFPGYGGGFYTAPPVLGLGVDISGKVVTFATGGGSGINIYNTDSLLSGDRQVDLNNHTIQFVNSPGGTLLSIIPYSIPSDLQSGTLAAHNPTGSDNLSQVQMVTTDTSAVFSIYADYQDGTKLTEIEAASSNGISTLEYTANTHTFNGIVNIIGSFSLPYIAVTSTYTITSLDYTVNCPSGTFTVTLPTAVGITGRIYVIKNSGAGTITLDGDGSETIDGSTTQPIPTLTSLTVQSTNAGWIIL